VVNTTVQNVDTDQLNVTQLSPSVQVSGIYFIGAGCAHAAGQFPAPLDQTVSSGGRAWIVGDTTPPLDYNNLNSGGVGPFEMDSIGLSGVWLLRGDCKDADFTEFCAGTAACPCGPPTNPLAGCPHGTPGSDGAHLGGTGSPSLATDSTNPGTVSLTVTNLRPSTLLVLWQGDSEISPVLNGNGLRCVSGSGGNPLHRIFLIARPTAGPTTENFPSAACNPANTSISNASMLKGDTITPGSRAYYVAYRDPTNGCGSSTFNTSNAVNIVWGP
jgi:hypothetical protein